MISHLLKKSTLAEDEFVCYDLEKIKYGTVIYNGVKSRNFLREDWQIITLERLFKNSFGERIFGSGTTSIPSAPTASANFKEAGSFIWSENSV